MRLDGSIVRDQVQTFDRRPRDEYPIEGEAIVASLVDQLPGKTGLVDVAIVVIADLAKGLNPDRQFAAVSARTGPFFA